MAVTKKCSCGKCSACKASMKGKYTEKKDKVKDAKMTKGLTTAEKREFEKKDKAHGDKKKPKTMAEDRKIDARIIKGIKKHSAHEKREGKAGEKQENMTPRQKKLAAMSGDKKKITRGDVIAAAKMKKKK